MTNDSSSNNSSHEVKITTEHLQELFRRLPAASEVMRFILLEGENNALKRRLEALEGTPDTAVTSATTPSSVSGESYGGK